MSRWTNKNRLHGFAFPLDSLAKEKENTNRPVAARSAGTVGKWGTTSFTSIRTPSYGYVAYTNNQDTLNPNTSPLSGDGSLTPQPYSAPDAPKPRKFFKSRNTVAVEPAAPFHVSPNAHQQPEAIIGNHAQLGCATGKPNDSQLAPKIRLKINKKHLLPQSIVETTEAAPSVAPKKTQTLTKAPKTKKTPSVAKEKPAKPVKPAAEPTRKLSRQRKTVNYTENRSRSPSPARRSDGVKVSNVGDEVAVMQAESAASPPPLVATSSETLDEEHPPIVLRISKGTAKLVRTDSDESPAQCQAPVAAAEPLAIATTAELLAVLTDDAPSLEPTAIAQPSPSAEPVARLPSPVAQPHVQPAAAAHRPHSIKIKIKTNFAHMICEPSNVEPPPSKPLAPTAQPVELVEQAPPCKRSARLHPQQPPLPVIPPLVVKLRSVSPVTMDTSTLPEKPDEKAKNATKSPSTATRRTAALRGAAVSPPSAAAVPLKATRQTRKLVATQSPEPASIASEPIVATVRSSTARSYTRKRRVDTAETQKATAMEVDDPHNMPPPSAEEAITKNTNCVVDLSVPATASSSDTQEPSVKLVISKKKGSIFKSRTTDATNTATAETNKAKRHQLYRHKWDHDSDNTERSEMAGGSNEVASCTPEDPFDSRFDADTPVGPLTKVIRARPQPSGSDAVDFDDTDSSRPTTSVRCDASSKNFYTVIRNVKKAHQIQEIGEFQEMDDDVDYILDALQSHNPMATRCLSAIQLASKCLTPAFRMHVRAHGTVTRFFKALDDAKNTQSLGLCTATVMFVLNQDNLNMDLDRDSLSLMLNLLESDASHQSALDDCGLTSEQLQRNREKVKEICAEIKSAGKAIHLNLDNITVGTLAMETLLSLTSKRAGEWFKEELRKLGGLEKIINTICECCEQIAGSDYVDEWEPALVEKLRKIERCLRVLENVSTQNEENQMYILNYRGSRAVDSLVRFYRLCTMQIGMHPTDETTAKDAPGVVLREALTPTLKVMINLTHPFSDAAFGSALIGAQSDVYETSLRLLFQVIHYVPEQSVFELSILVLLLLINLTTHTTANRTTILEARTPDGVDQEFDSNSAITALIHYFNKHEKLAQQVEENTDAILDKKSKSKRNAKSQEEVDETVTKLIQGAGTHMEHTLLASYVSLLIGYLIMDSPENQSRVRKLVRNSSFATMVQVLDKYYTFMNLTASSESATVAHIRQTKRIMEYFQRCDNTTDEPPPADEDDDDFDKVPVLRRTEAPQHQYRSMRNNPNRGSGGPSSSYSTYSGASKSDR